MFCCLTSTLYILMCDRCFLRHSPSKPSSWVYNRPQTSSNRSICSSSPGLFVSECPRIAVPPFRSNHFQLPHIVSGHARIHELYFCGYWGHRIDCHRYMDYHWKEEVHRTRGNKCRKRWPWCEGGRELSQVAVVSIQNI